MDEYKMDILYTKHNQTKLLLKCSNEWFRKTIKENDERLSIPYFAIIFK